MATKGIISIVKVTAVTVVKDRERFDCFFISVFLVRLFYLKQKYFEIQSKYQKVLTFFCDYWVRRCSGAFCASDTRKLKGTKVQLLSQAIVAFVTSDCRI
jgi:hypothetical protein